jgi:cadmium resistance protein CadD (predicted permease)
MAIALALGLSQGLEDLPGHWLSYLGILPVSLGVLELIRKAEHEAVPSAIGVVQTAVVLASNSGDSLAVLIATFSDGAEEFDLVTAIGACVGAVALTVGLILFSQRPGVQQYLGPIARKLQPWLMIVIGLIILLDTPIDVQ